MLILELFTPFDTFLAQYLLKNAFETEKKLTKLD